METELARVKRCPACGEMIGYQDLACGFCGASFVESVYGDDPQSRYLPPHDMQAQPPFAPNALGQPPLPAQNIYVYMQTPPPPPMQEGYLPVKSKTAAALLAFFLGGLGADHFYLGCWLEGFLCLFFCLTLSVLSALVLAIPIWLFCLIKGVYLLSLSNEDFSRKFHCRVAD